MRDLFGHQTAGDILEDIDPDNHDLIIREDDMKKGKIIGLEDNDSIFTIIVEPEGGGIERLHGDRHMTVEALRDAFEGENPRGQEIYYQVNDWGALDSFQPVGSGYLYTEE